MTSMSVIGQLPSVEVRSESDARDRFLRWGSELGLGNPLITESYGFRLELGEWEFDVAVGRQVSTAFVNLSGNVRAPALNISKKSGRKD